MPTENVSAGGLQSLLPPPPPTSSTTRVMQLAAKPKMFSPTTCPSPLGSQTTLDLCKQQQIQQHLHLQKQQQQQPQAQHHARGQIHLELQVQGDVLTVKVGQARLLESKWTDLCNPYIQLILCPDETRTSIQETETFLATNSPAFHQTFTYKYCASQEDKKKRLMIIAWNRNAEKKCSEFLGCLSFGLNHLASRGKTVNNWFYLLSEDLGHRKHIAVSATPHTSTCSSSSSASSAKSSSEGKMKFPEKMEKDASTVLLRKGSSGYGFTVRGSSPVSIGHVKDTGSAHAAGLQRGDIVVRLNGVNVLNETADKVAAIIRTSIKQIVVDIYQPQSRSKSRSSSSSRTPQSHLMCSPISLPTDSCNLDDAIMDADLENEENQEWNSCHDNKVIGHHIGHNVTPQLSFFSNASSFQDQQSRKRLYTSRASSHQSSLDSCSLFRSPACKRPSPQLRSVDQKLRTDSLGSLRLGSSPMRTKLSLNQRVVEGGNSPQKSATKKTAAPKMKRSDSVLPWIPDVSIMENLNSFAGQYVDELSLTDSDHSTDNALCQPEPSICGELLLQTRELTVVTDSSSQYGSDGDETGSVGDFSKVALRASAADIDRTTFMQASLLGTSQGKESLVQQLLQCEAHFVQDMQDAIQRYSRPLRYCVLPAADHAILFQNVEKLVAIAELCVYQLVNSGNAEGENGPDGVGLIYKTKMNMLCDAYETYGEGLPLALFLLGELSGFAELAAYLEKLQSTEAALTLKNFLSHPVQHLEDMLHLFQQVMEHSSPDDADYEDLETVVEALRTTCNKVAASTRNKQQHRERSDLSVTSSMTSGLTLSSTLEDSDIESLQNRVVCPKTGKHIHLAKKGRHLVFSGELICTSSGSCDPLKVMLFTDQLLITMETMDGKLALVERPVTLANITELDFSCNHPSEFCIKFADPAGGSSEHIALRAFSIEEKSTWKVLLQQRIKICKNQKLV